MTRTAVLVALCTIGVVACEATTPDPGPGSTRTITLDADDTGSFPFCDEAGNCQSLPNPNACARLVIEIDLTTGASCETCYAADGAVVRRTCEDTSVACDVVTIPEPDCVVCAYVNGAIVYSTCVAEEPSCVQLERFPPCEICYADDGSVVSDTCQDHCANVLCAMPLCEGGYEAVTLPGECCPVCMPIGHCDGVMCPMVDMIPECPEGSVVVRDPTDCCGYICEPVGCPEMLACPAIVVECPEGQELDFSPPHCCGACVPAPSYCYSSQDCGSDQYCTVETGECGNDPSCPMCDVCVGVCRAYDYVCPQYAAPERSACDGTWQDGGFDDSGCQLPPVCVCEDGRISENGKCEDACAEIACFWFPDCPEGQHVEMNYPYCCGVCVDDAPSCYSSADCADGYYCSTERGDCASPPGCGQDGMACPTVCAGTCERLDW